MPLFLKFGSVQRKIQIFLILALSVPALTGCASSQARVPVPKAFVNSAKVGGMPAIRIWGDVVPDNLDKIVALKFKQIRAHNPKFAKKGSRPKVAYLAISGGGEDGAFGAGFLNGWTRTGKRPQFDIVTGVSTGALMAPFAFLGSAYDSHLREIYTKYGADDLITKTPIVSLISNAALSDNSKFAGLIAKYIDQILLDEIALENNKGRRLLVGTTNLDAQRPVIWNMGAIAASGHPKALQLFRRVILASASIPGVFPPVMLDVEADGQSFKEMHVDGGTTSNVFFLPTQIMFKNIDKKYGIRPRRTLYIISNGRLNPEWKPIKTAALDISARSVSTLLKQHELGDLLRIFVNARRNKIAYRLASISTEFARKSTEPFDLEYMKALFEFGLKVGAKGQSWAKQPPGL